MKFTGLGIATVILPIYLTVNLAERFYGYDLYIREERTLFYIVAMFYSTVYLVLISFMDTPALFAKVTYSGLIAMTLGIVMNEYIKPSIHTGVLSGVAAVTAFHSHVIAVPVFALAAAVGWSRVRLEQHTVRDVVAGGLIAAFSVAAAFLLL